MKEDTPFKILGSKLRSTRLKSKQTLSEVSWSVEIDEKKLLQIELGFQKPSETVLESLIEHFKLSETEANDLFNLAGYSEAHDANLNFLEMIQSLLGGVGNKTVLMLSQTEQRAFFSDGLDVHYDKKGIMLNFKQSLGQPQPTSVAKIGMSYEQAEQVLKTISKALLRAKYMNKPSSLPPGSN
jgi:hypothetical protein